MNIDPIQWQLHWPAPAKLNLFLKVTGQREDGYHLLQTVFQLIDFADELTFRPAQEGVLVLHQGDWREVQPQQNLVYRAAKLLQDWAQRKQGIAPGVEIFLHKRLPSGAGLGGGSSDAATTLLALNVLWGVQAPLSELLEMGVRLGADVPFFLLGENAFAEGIGEKLVPLDTSLAQLDIAGYLLIVPPVQVPTPRIFQDPLLKRNSKPIVMSLWREHLWSNDLFSTVCRLYPAVAECAQALQHLGPVCMTGSGSALFVPLIEAYMQSPNALLAEVPIEYRSCVRIVKRLCEHPVLAMLRAWR